MDFIDTPFGFDSTALDVVADIDLHGRSAVVTGASSGLGIETARALAAAGASVTLAVRDLAAGEQAADDIAKSAPLRPLVAPLDLADLRSVRDFADRWRGPLHILICNAGVMATPEHYTDEGREWQFAVNHLGHFALATALQPALAAGAARIVSVSSAAHQRSPMVFDDPFFAFRPYDPWAAYAQSKTANVLFAVEATRRWRIDGITANAVMPGAIYTNLQRHTEGGRGSGMVPTQLVKSPQQGAATSVLVACSPALDGIGGRYFADCAEATTLDRRTTAPLQGVARYALDPANAARLWDLSNAMLAESTGAAA